VKQAAIGAIGVIGGAFVGPALEGFGLLGSATDGGSTAMRVFWSGGEAAKTAATKFAVDIGGETLGMTTLGQALTGLTEGMSLDQAQPLWSTGSKIFARGRFRNSARVHQS
jgi:hypothetical protein